MDLLVHPKSVFLIVYPGGFCGEFIAWWLSLHSKCVRTGLMGVGNNRYVGQHVYNYVYHEDGSRDFLFLTAHPGTTVSKNGFDVPDTDQHIIFYAGAVTNRFYFLLHLIKTVFARHTINSKPTPLCSDQQWEQFRQYLCGRTEFTGLEFEYWLKQEPCPTVADTIADRWRHFADWGVSSAPNGTSVNIDSLFFGDYATGYADLCEQLNLVPDPCLDHCILEYHQRNVDLVESYIGVDLETLFALDHDAAMAVMVQGSVKRQSSQSLV